MLPCGPVLRCVTRGRPLSGPRRDHVEGVMRSLKISATTLSLSNDHLDFAVYSKAYNNNSSQQFR